MSWGTSRDIECFVEKIAADLPIGIRSYLAYKLLHEERASTPVPLCMPIADTTISAAFSPNNPVDPLIKLPLWNALLTSPSSPDSINRARSSMPLSDVSFPSNIAYPIRDSIDVKAINIEPLYLPISHARSTSTTISSGMENAAVSILANGQHGSCIYSISTPYTILKDSSSSMNMSIDRNAMIPRVAMKAQSSHCYPLSSTCNNDEYHRKQQAHSIPKNDTASSISNGDIGYHTQSSSKLRMWRLQQSGRDGDDVSVSKDGQILQVPTTVRIMNKHRSAVSQSHASVLGEGGPHKTGIASGLHVSTPHPAILPTDSLFGAPNEASHSLLRVVSVLSADVTSIPPSSCSVGDVTSLNNGPCVAIVVEAYFDNGSGDVSTSLVNADGDSDVDSTTMSIRSGGQRDLQRLRRERRRRLREQQQQQMDVEADTRQTTTDTTAEEQPNIGHRRLSRSPATAELHDADFFRIAGRTVGGTSVYEYYDTTANDIQSDSDSDENSVFTTSSEVSEDSSVVTGDLDVPRGGGNSGDDSDSSSGASDRSSAVYTTKRRYYTIFYRVPSLGSISPLPLPSCISTSTTVASLQQASLREYRTSVTGHVSAALSAHNVAGLWIDQVPLLTRAIAPDLALVAGTNGLLSLVSSAGFVFDSTVDSDGNGNYSSYVAGAPYFSLTSDDFHQVGSGSTDNMAASSNDELPRGSIFPPPSHSSASSITAVDIQLQMHTQQYRDTTDDDARECFDFEKTIYDVAIISSDSDSRLVLWSVQLQLTYVEAKGCSLWFVLSARATDPSRMSYGMQTLYHSPLTSPMILPSRACGLTLSPSGSHVVVALYDRLLLVSLVTSTPRAGIEPDHPSYVGKLVVTSILDHASGHPLACTPAKYGVYFTADSLLMCSTRNIANESGTISMEPNGVGVFVDSWKVNSPDSFHVRTGDPALSPIATAMACAFSDNSVASSHRGNKNDASGTQISDDRTTCVTHPPLSSGSSRILSTTARSSRYVTPPDTRTTSPITTGGHTDGERSTFGRSCEKKEINHSRVVPLPDPFPAMDCDEQVRGVSASTYNMSQIDCERLLVSIFKHPDSREFKDVTPLLGIVLASAHIVAPPVPASYGFAYDDNDLSVEFGSNTMINDNTAADITTGFTSDGDGTPTYGGDTSRASLPVGLVAAALDMDIICLVELLTTYKGILKPLLRFDLPDASKLGSPTTDANQRAGFPFEQPRPSSIPVEAKSRGSATLPFDIRSLTTSQLHALGDICIVPTAMFLRAGVGYHLGGTDSCRLSSWAMAGPPATSGGGGGATTGWSSHSCGLSFKIDVAQGHNALTALYLAYAGCKSVAVEHRWHTYFREHGPSHLRLTSRGLRLLTRNIRKIDETAAIKVTLPRQLGFISGLQEIYARRVGLTGRLPMEICMLQELRVLSAGNNNIVGELPAALGALPNLQRIVLHQNRLYGPVPPELAANGCIVNLAGNSGLELGPDVPVSERNALQGLYDSTGGDTWSCHTNWCTSAPVAHYYKVGTLAGRVHSLVMSSNGMRGTLPPILSQLQEIRMIELATMSGLIGSLLPVCGLTSLRRLCICRCSLTGPIPEEIGLLSSLEELQLFGNRLSGSIPEGLGKLTKLKLLSLGEYTGGNDFTPAPIPACLRHLHELEALFLSSCHLTGDIPEWLCSLAQLRQLDLQHNDLSGSLPVSLHLLQNLLYLNFKDNVHLGGTLPVENLSCLQKLNRLSIVNTDMMTSPSLLRQLQTALPRCKVWN